MPLFNLYGVLCYRVLQEGDGVSNNVTLAFHNIEPLEQGSATCNSFNQILWLPQDANLQLHFSFVMYIDPDFNAHHIFDFT